jgi:hypothetical protein
MATDESTLDWTNLPDDAKKFSLWSTLHDGDLTAIVSDLMARTVTLEFDVAYVRAFHKLPAETRFSIIVSGVQSVRSLRNVPWPGSCLIPDGTPYEQQQTIVAEYHSKWREESLSWTEFEQLTHNDMEVSTALLVPGATGIALHLGLMVESDSYVDAFIRGENVAFSVGKQLVTPKEFVALGEAYWDAWSNKRQTQLDLHLLGYYDQKNPRAQCG